MRATRLPSSSDVVDKIRESLATYDINDPVEQLLTLAYVAVIWGTLRPSGSWRLRAWFMTSNAIFVWAGWLADLGAMIVANVLVFLFHTYRVVLDHVWPWISEHFKRRSGSRKQSRIEASDESSDSASIDGESNRPR